MKLMTIKILHFWNEKRQKEYIVLVTESEREREFLSDAKEDGYVLQNSAEFEGDIDWPINSVLDNR